MWRPFRTRNRLRFTNRTGWHFIVWEYRVKICGIVLNMFRSRDHLLPPNRSLVDEYINDPALDTLTVLLRPVQPFNSKLDDHFRLKTLKYAQEEEARIESNLQLMSYEIDAPSTLMLITGPGRIERVSLNTVHATSMNVHA
jgi:hypothetical protein